MKTDKDSFAINASENYLLIKITKYQSGVLIGILLFSSGQPGLSLLFLTSPLLVTPATFILTQHLLYMYFKVWESLLRHLVEGDFYSLF